MSQPKRLPDTSWRASLLLFSPRLQIPSASTLLPYAFGFGKLGVLQMPRMVLDHAALGEIWEEMALNQIEYNSAYACYEPRRFWSKVWMFFCFPIALSREETVFWHPHRVTLPHFIEGGSLQNPCAGWAQKLLILSYAPVQFCVCLLEPRHFWSKVCMFFCFPIALSREETVFWHTHRVTPPHFIEGGSLQKPCAGWAQNGWFCRMHLYKSVYAC